MTVRRTRGRGLTRVCCSSLQALSAYRPLFVCTSQFSPRADKDEGTNTPARLFFWGRSGFPSMLERSMAACLKVLFLLFLSLFLSLSPSLSSPVQRSTCLLLPPFMVVLGKVQPGCLDRVLEERRRRKGLQRFSSTLIAFFSLHSSNQTLLFASSQCNNKNTPAPFFFYDAAASTFDASETPDKHVFCFFPRVMFLKPAAPPLQ